MPAQPPDRDVAPTVQRLRIRYAKRGRLRFASHRDFQRAFERALRRAAVPMAYSAGFSPHPKISYAGAAPTGAASEAEYLEIGVTTRVDPGRVMTALNDALPQGLDILTVVEAGAGPLADRLTGSTWQIQLPGVPVDLAAAAVAALLAQSEVLVSRRTKSGIRTFDARVAVVGLDVSACPAPEDTCAILHLVVRHATPAVRPDDVLSALSLVSDLAPPVPPQVTRLAQGVLDEETGELSDPLQVDRIAADSDIEA
jgi:radical SAM-linked protein